MVYWCEKLRVTGYCCGTLLGTVWLPVYCPDKGSTQTQPIVAPAGSDGPELKRKKLLFIWIVKQKNYNLGPSELAEALVVKIALFSAFGRL